MGKAIPRNQSSHPEERSDEGSSLCEGHARKILRPPQADGLIEVVAEGDRSAQNDGRFFFVPQVLRMTALFIIVSVILIPCPMIHSAEISEEIYLTTDQALKQAFPKADQIRQETKTLTAGQRTAIEQSLGRLQDQTTYTIYIGELEGKTLGYATVVEEIGKLLPITFMVTVTPEGEVDRVSVMVYRESHGGEVRRRRFLAQYKGRRKTHPIRVNRDIINVSGATLSARGISTGVKRALFVIDAMYLNPKSGI